MAYRPIDPEIDKWTPFLRSAVPSSDIVNQQAGVVYDVVVFSPSDVATVTVLMHRAGHYVMAGLRLKEAGERPLVVTPVSRLYRLPPPQEIPLSWPRGIYFHPLRSVGQPTSPILTTATILKRLRRK